VWDLWCAGGVFGEVSLATWARETATNDNKPAVKSVTDLLARNIEDVPSQANKNLPQHANSSIGKRTASPIFLARYETTCLRHSDKQHLEDSISCTETVPTLLVP